MNSCFSSSSAGQGLMRLERGCGCAGQWVTSSRKKKGKHPAVRNRGGKSGCLLFIFTADMFPASPFPWEKKYNANLSQKVKLKVQIQSMSCIERNCRLWSKKTTQTSSAWLRLTMPSSLLTVLIVSSSAMQENVSPLLLSSANSVMNSDYSAVASPQRARPW